MSARIDLNYVSNGLCIKKCNKDQRKKITENDLCSQVLSKVDNLGVRCVGEWGMEKIYYLTQYFGLFAKAMRKKWNGKLNYIEICSGPGRCISRDKGTEFDGTALSIIKNSNFQYIEKAVFIDYDNKVVEILNRRINALNISNAIAIEGNYYDPNDIRAKVLNTVDPRSLNLVFIDPTDCSVPFSLVRHVAQSLFRADLIINIPIGTDLNRNLTNIFQNQEKYRKSISKYSRFLGSTQFFKDEKNIELYKNGNLEVLRNNFRETYKQSLKELNYVHFAFHRIRHFYDLIFASKHKLGLELWEKAKKIEFDGQRSLNF